MTKHKQFYLNTVWQYVLQAIKYLFPLLTLPYLTRVLEPEGYAVYAYVVSFMSFAQTFVDFGFNLSGTKEVAAAKSTDQLGKVLGSITEARILLCVLGGAMCAGVGAFIPIIRDNALYVSLAYLAVCGRALAPDFLFQGKENLAPITTRYFVSKGFSTLLTFVFVRSINDILWVPILDIIASVIALAWSYAAATRLFKVHIVRRPASDAIRELLKSGYYCLSNMSSAAFSGLTTLIIGIVITDAAQISYWSLAMTAVQAVQALYSPITNSLYPHMVVNQDFAFAKRLTLISIPFIAGGTLLFVAIADYLVLILGGAAYLPGAFVMRLVSPVLVFSFYGMLFGWPILGAAGRVRELTMTTLISSISSLVTLVIIAVLGLSSIALFAVVRSLTEAVMCGLRLRECYLLKQSISHR